jgi:ADP-L-glycero-D-manno-heptose 6-epimerase
MHIITGGAGFIGSAFARKLNQEGINDIVIVDELKASESWKNLRKIKYADYLHKDLFLKQVENRKVPYPLTSIVHMGACSSTTETNADYLMSNNYAYTKSLADFAVENGVRFIYASSAATYGDGAKGYLDQEESLSQLLPLNLYGYSKQQFDIYATQKEYLNKIVGLKFFNVFGPNEYHKEDMRSMVLKSYLQIKESGGVKLFRSHRPDFKDGEQKRDFVYVKDCCEVMWWLLNEKKVNGLFNLGSGKARSWNDLMRSVFSALKVEEKIQYVDMPDSIRNQYQYYTEASMEKLAETGCPLNFTSLENAVDDYVNGYLIKEDGYL